MVLVEAALGTEVRVRQRVGEDPERRDEMIEAADLAGRDRRCASPVPVASLRANDDEYRLDLRAAVDHHEGLRFGRGCTCLLQRLPKQDDVALLIDLRNVEPAIDFLRELLRPTGRVIVAAQPRVCEREGSRHQRPQQQQAHDSAGCDSPARE